MNPAAVKADKSQKARVRNAWRTVKFDSVNLVSVAGAGVDASPFEAAPTSSICRSGTGSGSNPMSSGRRVMSRTGGITPMTKVKTPKVYLRDSGMYHTLLGIHSLQELRRHPKLGPSWEGFALEEVVRHLRADPEDTYFWATHSGAELDLLIFQDGLRLGFEIKYTDRPRMTRSMRTAAEALKLDHLSILHPGEGAFPLAENIRAVGLRNLLSQAHPGGSRLSHSA